MQSVVPRIKYATPATIACSEVVATALAASTEKGPRAFTFQNVGSATVWIALAGQTATAADDQGWLKLAPGEMTPWIYDLQAITAICAAGLTSNLSRNGWGATS